jgi:hypothetical protein
MRSKPCCWKFLITVGGSPIGPLGTLQTRRSPSIVCDASMSDFCFDEEPCQANCMMGEGGRCVLSVCRIVKEGCNAAIKIEPFRYLYRLSATVSHALEASLCVSYPIAKALQSADGAKAVMGS